jgi:hypothetical protein
MFAQNRDSEPFSRPGTIFTLFYRLEGRKIVNDDAPLQFIKNAAKLSLLLQTGSYITQFSIKKSAITEIFDTALG